MSKKHKKKKTKKSALVLSPKGCAICALFEAHLISQEDFGDERLDFFYDRFCDLMREHGYLRD